MKNLKIIVFLLLGIFSLLYIYLFRDTIPQNNVNFLDNVITTFVSTLLSIIVGIFLYEYQQKENKKSEKNRFIAIITAESCDILSILTNGGDMAITLPSGETMNVLITILSPLAHEEAAKSGEFSPVLTENLFHISRKIRMYNMKVEHLLGLIRTSSSQAFLKHAIENVNETKNAIIDDCNFLSEQLK
ncbi:hypothetical protein [Sulfuricurvum sp.]|uniref:hypothetical protein n=1 Tax=Sulfuricurvum sp. TaxID=2025608 RepID=UPI00263A17CA|nr:hypothetical protein [Sulfuricurvum sp.]MDD2266322.1 hypothetical protein [Sulfuricurvum sp.]MDD2784746.1 hypothetical protein [Sulfuricurvum sp.]